MSPLSISHHTQILQDKKKPVVRLVFALLTLSCLLIATLAGWGMWSFRTHKFQEAEVSTTNIAYALASHAESVIKIADIMLEGIVEKVERDGLADDKKAIRELLERMANKANELQGLFVFDEHGNWIATSLGRDFQANNSDRAYFKYHEANADRKLHIGAPVRSRSTGIWVIPISRRLQHPDGSFAGVALATMRLNFFESVYGSLDVGQSGTIIFALDSGTLLYRKPVQEDNIGADISSGPLMKLYRENGPVGSAMLTARIDKITRLYSYRHLNNYPLLVAAALSEDEIHSDWYRTALNLTVGLLFFITILFLLTTKLLRQLSIRERLEEQLHAVSDGLTQANKELSVLALKDGLTQIANRRAFDKELNREHARAVRKKIPFSLLLLDVDWFKKFNDGYGHQAGDQCLKMVARTLADQVTRQSDLVARYGGEEFAVLLPHTDAEGARITAERIRKSVADMGYVHEFSTEKIVTVSIGVATLDPSVEPNLSASHLVRVADHALYQSKNLGRNRVSVSSGEI